jgi:hypothetical protein
MLEMQKIAAMETEFRSDISIPTTINSILQQLRENADNHLITVLIFDQFVISEEPRIELRLGNPY